LAAGLIEVPELRYIKVFPERIAASDVLSQDGKKNPVVVIGAEGRPAKGPYHKASLAPRLRA
jgi:hypothetical protein